MTDAAPTIVQGVPANEAPPQGAQPAVGNDTPAAAPAPAEAPDWRAALAGDNQDFAKLLTRFNDPTEVTKSLVETQRALRESGRVKVPGPNATAEEQAAFRQALGVPEKPEDYKVDVKVPLGVELGDADKQFLSQVQADLHKLGAPPQFVQYAHELYFKQLAEGAAQRIAAGEQVRQESETLLRHKWGREFETNVGFANAAITQFGMKELVNERLESGALLGDHPAFAQAMAKIGRLNADDPYFLQSAMGGAAQDPEARRVELMNLRTTDPRRYNSPEVQGELQKIYAAQERRRKDLQSA